MTLLKTLKASKQLTNNLQVTNIVQLKSAKGTENHFHFLVFFFVFYICSILELFEGTYDLADVVALLKLL